MIETIVVEPVLVTLLYMRRRRAVSFRGREEFMLEGTVARQANMKMKRLGRNMMMLGELIKKQDHWYLYNFVITAPAA